MPACVAASAPKSRFRLAVCVVAQVALGLCVAASTCAQTVPLKSIAVLDFELVDDQQALAPATVEHERLRTIRQQLAHEIASNGLYAVIDASPAAEAIARQRAVLPLHECNGCELDIARSLRAERVLVGWVQKVSNLILNINIRIEDAATGAVLVEKSVDLRGNTDESWRRGVTALVRSMVERGQGNR